MQKDFVLLDPKSGSAHYWEATISDLSRLYGVSLRTLRFYEDKGLLHPRRQGASRFYSAKDRIRLALILKGKRLGFTLAEIHDLIIARTGAVPETADLTVTLDADQIAAQIAHLERQRRELDAAIEELRAAHSRMIETVV